MSYMAKDVIISFLVTIVFCATNSKYLLVKFEEPDVKEKVSGRSLGSLVDAHTIPQMNPLLNHPNLHLLNEEGCGMDRKKKSNSARIVGGSDTRRGEFPWLTFVSGGGFTCGGSLISSSWVLTAAHCVTVKSGCRAVLEKKDVLIGHHDKTKRNNAITVSSENIIAHPDFTFCNGKSDIALIKLSRPVLSNRENNINTVCLPLEYPKELFFGLSVTVAGHGDTKIRKNFEGEWESWDGSNVMKKLDTKLVTPQECAKAHHRVRSSYSIFEGQNLCTEALEGQDSCAGDSGGPLMTAKMTNNKKQWFQVGVVSWGQTKCGTKGIPGVYTNVKTYLKWILDNLN